MCHTHPSIKETSIQYDCLLEIFPGNFKFLTMKVIGSNRKPADRMGGIIFDQIMSTVIKITSEVEIKQACNINW